MRRIKLRSLIRINMCWLLTSDGVGLSYENAESVLQTIYCKYGRIM